QGHYGQQAQSAARTEPAATVLLAGEARDIRNRQQSLAELVVGQLPGQVVDEPMATLGFSRAVSQILFT
ncbi:hypothetical protein, partial [Paraburkholderia nodosa]|uniref:hypothetical protein n=1 Tax=Paraburkholderia nodosa TaxID=392320 RepID=UPI000482BE1A